MDERSYRDVLLRLSALERRMNALFRIGVAAEVTLDPYRVRLNIGPGDDGRPVLTDPVPVFVMAAGAVRVWSPVAVGELCALFSPGGEDFSAFAMPALYGSRFMPPSDAADLCVMTVGRSRLAMSDSDILLNSPHIGLND